jgi:hypothetical protein
MTRLGAITAAWFVRQDWAAGCVSTFGGDELIIAAVLQDPAAFGTAITGLRDQCRHQLPRAVSFACTVVTPAAPGADRLVSNPSITADLVLADVDRALFKRKAERKYGGPGAFVTTTSLDLRQVSYVPA